MGEKPVPIFAWDAAAVPASEHEAFWWPADAPVRRIVLTAGSYRRLEALPLPHVGDDVGEDEVVAHTGESVVALDLVTRTRVALRRAGCGFPGCGCLAVQWFAPGSSPPAPDPFWFPTAEDVAGDVGCPCGCRPPWEEAGG